MNEVEIWKKVEEFFIKNFDMEALEYAFLLKLEKKV